MRQSICTAGLSLLTATLLGGCSFTPTATPIAQSGPSLRGMVHGGRQPIAGASVYLYAAGSGGYGGASVSLLNANVIVNNPLNFGVDTGLNYYVVTDATGHFDISGDYTCTPGQPVYIYSIGGDPGSGSANSAAGLAAILGVCPASGNFAAATPNVIINEVTTVVTAYAFAGFATDATHVSSSSTTLGLQGIRNAFTNSANLVDLNTGHAYTSTPLGSNNSVTVPQQTIYTLANILASCVNSDGPSSTSCSTIFGDVPSSGTSGSTATETTTAAIYIAHNPGINVSDLFNLAVPSSPFNPGIPASSPPNDFTLALVYNDFSINNPTSVAIDANGNAWVTNYSGGPGNSVAEINGVTTAMLSPSYPGNGYTGGGLSGPYAIAIDQSGNAWVADSGVGSSGASISELRGTDGAPLSGTNGYTGGGMLNPIGIAVDANGYIWVANGGSTVTQIYGSNAAGGHSPGDIASGASGYTGGGINGPQGVAIDQSGFVWLADGAASISALYGSNATGGHAPGDPLSPSGGYFSGGDVGPLDVAVDANGYIWSANSGIPSVSQLYGSNAVSPHNPGDGVSSDDGYTADGSMQGPSGIAIDGIGNVWVANDGAGVVALYGSNATSPNNPGDSISGGVQYTAGGIYGNAEDIAVDGSGNVWVADGGNYQVVELIGAAYPVVTPIVANLLPPYSHPASLP